MNQDPLRLSGKISWQRQDGENYQYGIEFTHLDELQRNRIKECFEFLKRNAEF